MPKILREAKVSGHSDTVSGVMSRLQSTLDEIKRLDGDIRQRVKARKLNGHITDGVEPAAEASAGSQRHPHAEDAASGT